MSSRAPDARRYAVIIPACNEEACIGEMICELLAQIDTATTEVVVGVNGTTDATVEVARAAGARVAETDTKGYGYGCVSAIELVEKELPPVDGYVFMAADGGNDPADAIRLIELHEEGVGMVLGQRTFVLGNRAGMGHVRGVSNIVLGGWCGVLTGRFFSDLGPLRLISRRLYEEMRMREFTYGWTIEAQVLAVRLGAKIVTTGVKERRRMAGEQKVSGVSLRHTLRVGREIFSAGLRSRCRLLSDRAEIE